MIICLYQISAFPHNGARAAPVVFRATSNMIEILRLVGFLHLFLGLFLSRVSFYQVRCTTHAFALFVDDRLGVILPNQKVAVEWLQRRR